MINILLLGLDIGKGAYGGVANFNRLLMKHMDSNDFKVTFFAVGRSPNWFDGNNAPSKYIYYITHIKKIVEFLRTIKTKRADLVHINSGLTQASLLRYGIFASIAKIAGCRTLFFIHGWKQNELDKISRNKLKKTMFYLFLKKQDAIGVLSNQFKQDLVEIGINGSKVFVFSTMVDVSKFIVPEKKFDELSINVLFCANPVRKKKGIYEFLQAAPLVLKKQPFAHFTIMGGGKELLKLKQYVKCLNIDKNVNFTGFIEGTEKITIFNNAHVLLFPSYTEGFPTTVVEAMAAGMAVVSTAVGGLADAIVDKKNGVIIKSMPPEPREIATKLTKLISNPKLMQKISVLNYNESREKYSARSVSARIGATYLHIMNAM